MTYTGMKNWRTEKLGNMARIVLGGTPDTSKERYWNGEIDWVTAKDVSACTTAKIERTERTISQDGLENSAAKLLPALTTVIIARGATMGECCMLEEEKALNQTCYGILAGPSVDAVFLYYAVDSAYRNLRSIAHGSVFDTVNMESLGAFEVSLPPLPQQRRIADVLGALDDKIALNRRMNHTLEAMAQALYRHWFIDFGPFQDGDFAESELGPIPQGWTVKQISDIAKFRNGKRPESKVEDGPYPIWGANGPTGKTNECLFDENLLVTGRVGTLGSVFRITFPVWPSDNTITQLVRYGLQVAKAVSTGEIEGSPAS